MKSDKFTCPNCESANYTEVFCSNCLLRIPRCEMCKNKITFLEYIGKSGHKSGLCYIVFRCSKCSHVNKVEQPDCPIKCPICQTYILDKRSCLNCGNSAPSCHICREPLSFLDYVGAHGKRNSPYSYHYFRCPECTTLIDMRERHL